MKHFSSLFIVSFLCLSQIYSQTIDCDGRYETEIFNDVNIETITYSDLYNLQMDIYTPAGDNYTNRPLLIFAHGGSFIGGSKTNPTMVDLCETFAKRGYVTASINYRLATHTSVLGTLSGLFWMTDLENGINVIYSAMSDAKAAVRFFRKDVAENGNTYGIDDTQIWMGGNSAGACLGPHMTYITSSDEFVAGIEEGGQSYATDLTNANGGIEGNSGNLGYSSAISGIISLAGALHTVEWIDETDTTPIVSCHGTEDETVPDECGTILNSPNNLTACGSMAIHPILSDYGIINDLLIYEGEAHCPWDFNATYKQQMIDFVSSFVYQSIDCNETSIDEINSSKELIYRKDLLGRTIQINKKGFVFNVYKDGTVDKQYILHNK